MKGNDIYILIDKIGHWTKEMNISIKWKRSMNKQVIEIEINIGFMRKQWLIKQEEKEIMQ